MLRAAAHSANSGPNKMKLLAAVAYVVFSSVQADQQLRMRPQRSVALQIARKDARTARTWYDAWPSKSL